MTNQEILDLAKEVGFEQIIKYKGSGTIVLPNKLFINFAERIKQQIIAEQQAAYRSN